MKWTDSYLSIPFADRGLTRKGCDCYGLCRLIMIEQCGVTLPEYPDALAGQASSKLRQILGAAQSDEWSPVERGGERAFDFVLMRGQFRTHGRLHSRPIHVACVVAPGTLIHTEEGAGVSVVNYRSHHMIRSRIDSFWRLVRHDAIAA